MLGFPLTGIEPKSITSPSILTFGIIIFAFIGINIFFPPLTITVIPESTISYLPQYNLTFI